MKYVISNNMPILFEENALETVRARGFVRFHEIESNINFTFGNRVGE
jgi:hypothetical protein